MKIHKVTLNVSGHQNVPQERVADIRAAYYALMERLRELGVTDIRCAFDVGKERDA